MPRYAPYINWMNGIKNSIKIGILLYVIYLVLDLMKGGLFEGTANFIKYVALPIIFILAYWQTQQRRIRRTEKIIRRMF